MSVTGVMEKTTFDKHAVESVRVPASIHDGDITNSDEELEVFKAHADGINYRAVTWQKMILIMLKVQVATGVLSIPSALGNLGAVPGALVTVGWQVLNTYNACLLIDYRNRHRGCHTIVDMAGVAFGPIGREIMGVLFLLNFILVTGSGLVGTATAFNALTEHGACTVWFSFVALILIVLYSSIPTFNRMTWPMTLAFGSIMGGVLAVTIGVSLTDRPAAAPKTGPYDFGFEIIGHPTFAQGVTSAASIYIASAAGPVYLPIISEMVNPKDYRKSVIPVGIIVGAIYLSISMTVYYYCGKWIATPSLGSAGPLVKKIAYGIALPSLVVSGGLFNHAGAKYIFVRLLRKSRHLQANTWQHWTLWLGITASFGIVAFLVAEAIPVFNYILSLAGSICSAPMNLIFPALFWMKDFGPVWMKRGFKGYCWIGFHVLMLLVGCFMTIGGVYGVAISIKSSYNASSSSVFSCADNSNTVT